MSPDKIELKWSGMELFLLSHEPVLPPLDDVCKLVELTFKDSPDFVTVTFSAAGLRRRRGVRPRHRCHEVAERSLEV